MSSENKDNEKIRILIISRNVPPRCSGTSVVIENLSTGFTKDEILIVGERFIGNNPPINNELKPKLKFITVLFKTNMKITNLLRKIQIITGFFLLLFHTIRFSPHKIIVVYPSAEFFFMGYLLSKLYKADYYTYFHNTYYENRKGFNQKIAGRLQNKMFNLSKVIFCISDGMKEYYQNNYSGYTSKFITLSHSFTEKLPTEINVKIKEKVKVGFAGSINESCKDAANRMFRTLSLIKELEFRFFTELPESYFVNLGIDNQSLEIYSSLERIEFLKKLFDCDILILPHGLTGNLPKLEYNTIFPTKTIEYLISGKPIFYHGPSDAFLTKFILQNNCAETITSNNEIEIKDKFYNLMNDESRRQFLVQNSLNVAKTFERDNVINIFTSHLK